MHRLAGLVALLVVMLVLASSSATAQTIEELADLVDQLADRVTNLSDEVRDLRERLDEPLDVTVELDQVVGLEQRLVDFEDRVFNRLAEVESSLVNGQGITLEEAVDNVEQTVQRFQTNLANLDDLIDLLPYVSVDTNVINGLSGPHVIFTGANVHVRSGSGATFGAVGLGNLVVGYNEVPASPTRGGSHNLVVGVGHNYPASAGFVAGSSNTVSGNAASVAGGGANTASGGESMVVGGQFNIASGSASVVSGGSLNIAANRWTTVSGGRQNNAVGQYASVSGGLQNSANAEGTSILGGERNSATGLRSVVLGAFSNQATVSHSIVP